MDATTEDVTPPEQLPCPNCGDPTEGNYCRICGQRKSQHRASLRNLLSDAFEDQFSIVTELPRTLRFLFTKPGFLTAEYSAGRIARYIPPFRLYVLATIVLVVAVSFRARTVQTFAEAERARYTAPNAGIDSATLARVQHRRDSLNRIPDSQLRESDRCLKHSVTRMHFCTPTRWLNEFMAPRITRLDQIPPGEVLLRVRDFLIQRSPTVLTILMPIFALMLKFLWWKSKRYYAEHFVFALHLHAMACMVFAFIVWPLHSLAVWSGGGKPIADFEYVAFGLMLWVGIYAIFALKRFYQQGWPLTIAKAVALATAYVFILGAALTAEVATAMLVI